MNDAEERDARLIQKTRASQHLNRKLHAFSIITGLMLSCLLAGATGEAASAPPAVQYSRDVRPILSEKCFHCHGPDAAARKADLRLDQSVDATADRGGYRVIVPGEPSRSLLLDRISSAHEDERMPPPDSSDRLTDAEIDVLRRWIQSGARYQRHWSFIPPQRPELPETENQFWSRNAIDHFVLKTLERHQLKPTRRAGAAILVRRLSLDLTGLPPSVEEVNTFEQAFADNPTVAISKLVDRLLKSPRYGEHMAVNWLDAARYADTNGYFTDDDRTMWPWRDWVINAFNTNMPFDQFTIEQLAGDLIPGATLNQKVATGFNRNHMVNNETGIIEEEFRVEYVADRTDTTATVWMGLTLGCARCHDHKYDPVSQSDYYRFFAFFNNVPERGLSGSGGNSTPFLPVPDRDLQQQLERARNDLATSERDFARIQKELDLAQAAWEKTAITDPAPTPETGLVAHYPLDLKPEDALTTGSVMFVDGVLDQAVKTVGDGCISFSDSPDFDRDEPFSIGAWVHPQSAGCIISRMDDINDMRGFDITLRKSKVVVNLVHRWNRNAIQVATTSSLPSGQWQHVLMTWDGSSQAAGVTVYVDGQPQPVEILQDTLTATIRNTQPLRLGRRQTSASLTGLIDDVRIYDRQLNDEEVRTLAGSQLIQGILAKPAEERSDSFKRKLRDWFVSNQTSERTIELASNLEQLRRKVRDLAKQQPTAMVMQETESPRSTFVLMRGEYDQPGQKVTAGLPEFSRTRTDTETAERSSLTRLDLAQWLVSPTHPLTARVTVNRIWEQLFGTGLVRTTDDFGTQGDWPSHPELLDWLAIELVESGWNLQHILKLIVTSATYQQSSDASPEAFALDPENRLLARGPRFRMKAEMLRDNALAISDLLVEKIGGPPVKPYQPDGLWKEVTYDGEGQYVPDTGESLYRRSLYTFWKRQAPPPALLTFDAPTRETCTVQRTHTNTPLQALVLMNDPTFIEASRHLAERMMRLTHIDDAGRLNTAFRAATARRPTEEELQILLELFHAQKVAYERNPKAARDLLTVGESPRDQSLAADEAAAWTTVVSTILSLDETITRR